MLETDLELAEAQRSFWQNVFRRLHLDVRGVDELAGRSARNGTDILSELRATGRVSESALFRAIAAELDLPSVETIEPKRLEASEARCVVLLRGSIEVPSVRYAERVLDMSVLIAPFRLGRRKLEALAATGRDARRRLRLVPPQALRAALAARARDLLSRQACGRLAETWPQFSARTVVVAWQSAFFGAFVVLLPVSLMLAPTTTASAFHFVFSLLFLSCVTLRACAAWSAAPPRPTPPPRRLDADMPVYTIVVALYREAAIVPDLLAALGRLFWPRAKLEVKLVCEEEDRTTLAALEALPLRSTIEIIRVPAIGPRTKPKALAYALPFCRGEIVALYDAEDRPHPMQLVEAWQALRTSDKTLACVQAPLSVSNRAESLVASSFAFEYAALFRGLLPWLAGRGLVLPLGGTSNHFRRAALEEVGGWDPYNVTEDADLGLRLGRFGYRTGLIGLPTLEEGPHRWSVWLPQRTRWFKGWMQTWLVHMRNPAALRRELGWRSFLACQVLFAGMIASALVYPVFVGTLAWICVVALLGRELTTFHSTLFLVDSVNISLGYLAFLTLGWKTLPPRERPGFIRIVLFTPLYWLMMSVAAWRALGQIFRDPHGWEKTPHRPQRQVRTVPRQAGARKPGPSPMMSGSSEPTTSASFRS